MKDEVSLDALHFALLLLTSSLRVTNGLQIRETGYKRVINLRVMAGYKPTGYRRVITDRVKISTNKNVE